MSHSGQQKGLNEPLLPMSQLRNLASLLVVALFLSGALATAHCQTLAPPAPRAPHPPHAIPTHPAMSKPKSCPMANPFAPQADGNFILGPTHPAVPEMAAKEGVPQGPVYRVHHVVGRQQDLPRNRAATRAPSAPPDPNDPANSRSPRHPAPYTRNIAVYVPKQYVPGTAAPFHYRRRWDPTACSSPRSTT